MGSGHGISISEILPFFEHYRLPLRVVDEFGKLVFEYDPVSKNKRVPLLFCMKKGDHIYTLNYNLDRLDKTCNKQDDLVVKASSNYNIKENNDVVQYKMMSTVDDVISFIKNIEETEKTIINLILDGDNLV